MLLNPVTDQLVKNLLILRIFLMFLFQDTAECYHNEADIGTALKELLPKHNLQREDIQITTKLFTTDQGIYIYIYIVFFLIGLIFFLGKGLARAAALKSIQTLNCGYLDLYLIHWPGAGRILASSPDNFRLRKESWFDLAELHKEGLLRSVGVSNYTIRHLEQLLADCAGVRPAVNQVIIFLRLINKCT